MRPRFVLALVAVIAATALAVSLVPSGLSAAGSSANFGFEAGDLSEWASTIPPGGVAAAVTSYATGSPSYVTYDAMHGTFFALLKTDGPGSYTSLSRAVSVEAGDTLEGWAFFDTDDSLPYEDNAQVRILDAFGSVVDTPFEASVSTVGSQGETPWTLWQYTVSAGGEYTIEARVANDVDSAVDSYMGFDMPENAAPQLAVDYGSIEVDEGSVATNTGTVTDADGDVVQLSASVGTVVNQGDGTWQWSYRPSDGPDETGFVSIVGTDGRGGSAVTSFSLIVRNVAPTITGLTGPTEPVSVSDQPVTVSVTFDDPGADAHEVSWQWGDGASSATYGATSPSSADHMFAGAGLYPVTVTVSDEDGDSDTKRFEHVVVYDADAGFVTGGGWFDSAAGSYLPDPTLEGEVEFGFVGRYRPTRPVPMGGTEIRYAAAGLEFASSGYTWVIVAGTDKAKIMGSGTIGGEGDYGFMLTAVDNDAVGDSLRMKIWDKEDGCRVVYDNVPGAGDESYAGTVISRGNIEIHRP